MKNLYKRVTLSILILTSVLFYCTSVYSQTTDSTPLTIENINQNIGVIQTKIESLNYRIAQLQSNSSSQEDINYINRLKESKSELTKELEKLEKVKTSVEYADQNNLIEKKNSNEPINHTYNPSQKVKLTQSEFDALPEEKKQAVLAHPEQYEIIN